MDFFNKHEPIYKTTGNLPHWTQYGKITFVTFRLTDSLPLYIIDNIKTEYESIKQQLLKEGNLKELEFLKVKRHNQLEKYLDKGYGSCLLKNKSLLRSHSESVWIETEKPISVEEAQKAIAAAPGCTLKDDPANLIYSMPLETAGKDDVYVGRVRKDIADDCGLTFWLSGDQIRKGAALNAVQIAEYLYKVGNHFSFYDNKHI